MPNIKLILRLEGLALAVITAVLYARYGAGWGLFAALWLVPDLSMLGYLAGPRVGAISYNIFHTTLEPAALGLVAYFTGSHLLVAIALIWANHIGIDRLLGYGLKSTKGFKITHLN